MRILPEVGCSKSREHPEQRRLAAAGAAEDREQLAAQDVERHVVARAVTPSKLFVSRSGICDAAAMPWRVVHRPVFTRDQSLRRGAALLHRHRG